MELYEKIRATARQDRPYQHLVGFRFDRGEEGGEAPVSEAELTEISERFAAMIEETQKEVAGVYRATMARNVDDRKGWLLLEEVVFLTPEHFIAWHQHLAHQAFAAFMSAVPGAVWVVLDQSITDPAYAQLIQERFR